MSSHSSPEALSSVADVPGSCHQIHVQLHGKVQVEVQVQVQMKAQVQIQLQFNVLVQVQAKVFIHAR